MRAKTRFGTVVVVLATILAAGVPIALADTTPPPNKANSPATDLKDYPKLPPSSGPAVLAAVGTPSPSVVAVVAMPDGTVQETIFYTADGVTAEQHYQELSAAGVPGLQDPASAGTSSDAVAAAQSCSYGTARLECFGTNGTPLHWANGCCSHPQIYFVDHTSSAWPVDVSTYEWNQAQGVDSIYEWATCPGYSGTHCVNLYDANHGDTGEWLNTPALTTLSWNTTTNDFVDGQVRIDFNDYPGFNLTANMRRQAVCQEQGHALGMNHNTSTNSCMYGTALRTGTPLYPDSNDFTLIAQLYSVWHN